MSSIEVLETGLVYRNPYPHLVSRGAYFPSLVELAGGELVAAFDIGSAFEALDVRSYVCRSSDAGRSWSQPQLIFEPDESSHRVSTSCRISLAPDGQLVGLAALFSRTRTDVGLSNPQTEGFVWTDMAILRSNDCGYTWSEPEMIRPPIDWHVFEICSPIIPLTTERWLAPSAIWPDWEGKCPLGAKAIVFISDDGGKSWPKVADVMDGWAEKIASWEQKQIRLSDGRLLAVCWAFDYKSRQNLVNHYTFSNNDGDSYSGSLKSPLHGETCTPLALFDNHILCIYRRMDKKGLWAHLAKIEGQMWQPLADAILWGNVGKAYNSESESMVGQMSSLRFGCPSVVHLANGEILTVFWCVEECVSNIRWFRLNVEI